MEYAIVSDIHANYPALTAVLEDSDVDGLICCGDMLGLLGFPSETVETLQSENLVCGVKGNHDIATIETGEIAVTNGDLGRFEQQITDEYLSETQKEWVSSHSSYQQYPEENLLVAHAKPSVESSSGTTRGNAGIKKRDYISVGADNSDEYDYILLGHTHDQAAVDCRKFGHDITVLNPGSVGQPLDGPAEYAVIDTDSNTHDLRSVEFDSKIVREKLNELDVPIMWWR